MVRTPTSRRPTHPGEILLAEFMIPLGLTVDNLSVRIGIETVHLDAILSGQDGITQSDANGLAQHFGISQDFWMNLQLRYDRALKDKQS